MLKVNFRLSNYPTMKFIYAINIYLKYTLNYEPKKSLFDSKNVLIFYLKVNVWWIVDN